MQQRDLIARIAARMKSEPKLRGLFLAGSFGSGTDDAFSDVDLVGVAAPDDHRHVGRRDQSID